MLMRSSASPLGAWNGYHVVRRLKGLSRWAWWLLSYNNNVLHHRPRVSSVPASDTNIFIEGPDVLGRPAQDVGEECPGECVNAFAEV